MIRFAALLSACALVACGGRAAITGARDSGAGGSGGASGGAGSGGSGPECDCASGYHCQTTPSGGVCVPDGSGGSDAGVGATSGYGGSGASAGSTGSGGTTEAGACGSGASFAPELGFGVAVTPTTGTVAKVQPDSLGLVAADGTALDFKWRGPDLTGHFHSGDPVGFGWQDGWDYVAGTSSLAATRQIFDMKPQPQIPPLPFGGGPQLSYGMDCQFTDGTCGFATFTMLTVDATTGAGKVSVGQGETGQIAGWQIHNLGSEWAPGSSSGNCVAEPAFNSELTALGPSPVNGGP